MERMEKRTDFYDCIDKIQRQDRYIKELEEENKTLKDNVEFLHSCLDDRDKSIAIMQEENKNLKEENEYRKSIVDIIPEGEGNVAEETIKDLQDRIKELKEEVRFLEECLDNKEKLNKGYREDVDYWHHRCMVAERGGEDEE